MKSLTTSQVSDLIVEGLMYLVKETSGNAPAVTVSNVLLAFLKNVDDMDIVFCQSWMTCLYGLLA